MDKTKIVGILIGAVAAGLVALSIKFAPPATPETTAEADRAERHRQSMEAYYRETPPAEDAETGNYLDTRTGPELERTAKRAIEMAGYRCANVTSARNREPGIVRADCGADGAYVLAERGKDIRVLKE